LKPDNSSVSFVRYYDKNYLVDISMNELSVLIDKREQEKIANYIYQRLYTRFLKIFDYKCLEKKMYLKNKKEVEKNVFNEEYKSGFLMAASCCLLVETLASFLLGRDKTPIGTGNDSFNSVFEKAVQYKNDLQNFKDKKIYQNIRNALLHQGETYNQFTITRQGGTLIDSKKINSTEFVKQLIAFLKSYKYELETSAWDSEIWEKCKIKLNYIIQNA
jgi:hypothetical protein